MPGGVSISHCGWTACGGPDAGMKKSWDPDSDPRIPGRVSQLCSQLRHFTNKACETRVGHSVSKWEEVEVQPLSWVSSCTVPTPEDSPSSALPSHSADPSSWSYLLPALKVGTFCPVSSPRKSVSEPQWLHSCGWDLSFCTSIIPPSACLSSLSSPDYMLQRGGSLATVFSWKL